MRVLGIVPARGGSKGIPRKNVRYLCGRPLLAYTAEAALKARRLTRVVLSTEDEEIARVGREYGLEVPFLRPTELAQDDSPTLPVVQHVLRQLLASGDSYDAVCLLQPTHPLRRAEDIDFCIGMLEDSGADAVVSVLPVPAEHNPHWTYFRAPGGNLRLSTGEASPIPRRQSLPPAFHREGSIYVTRAPVILEQNSLFGARLLGHEVDPAQSVNIDGPHDWQRAEHLISNRLSKGEVPN